MSRTPEDFEVACKALLTRAGVSQTDVARSLGLDPADLSNAISGRKPKRRTRALVEAIAGACGASEPERIELLRLARVGVPEEIEEAFYSSPEFAALLVEIAVGKRAELGRLRAALKGGAAA